MVQRPKNYGFLKPGDGGFSVYVHVGAVERAGMMDLKVGAEDQFRDGYGTDELAVKLAASEAEPTGLKALLSRK